MNNKVGWSNPNRASFLLGIGCFKGRKIKQKEQHNWNNAEEEGEIRNVNSLGGRKGIKVKHLFFEADDRRRDRNECLFGFISVGGVFIQLLSQRGGCSLLLRPEKFAPCSEGAAVNIRICSTRMSKA
ncbi:hypothetical protein CDAR_509411 [Caerostris darwini]|uniref:Uncharacterized protein n=1 Tax=Caerostris darwini TaxID=1538125 RepID=A0AAV4UUM1_9ARAC|nr:hypothetical protein CDAR_509411 [Caerostris darwini]